MFETQSVNNEIIIDGFNSIYYFEFSKDFFHEPEEHGFWEMVYVDSGSINAVTDGFGYTLSQGQAIFHQPGEMHAHISDRHVANNMLVISFSTRSEAMEYFKGKTFTLDKTSKILLSLFLEEAKNALGAVPGDYTNRNSLDFSHEAFGASQLLKCHFTELLIKLIRSGNTLVSDKGTRISAQNSICELVCEYMRRNLSATVSLKDLCKIFSVGKTQMCKIFREELGQSPMDYYRGVRIEEAKKLLREKNHSISEIADIVGYSSIHIFSRAFKAAVGISPTEYSKRIL